MSIVQKLTFLTVLVLLAGCATGGGSQGLTSFAGRSRQESRADKEKRSAVRALKKDGIDADNLLYWKPRVGNGCAALESFPLPKEDPVVTARLLEREFGPLQTAFSPYFAVSEEAKEPVRGLPREATWEGFLEGFNSLKEKMALSREGAGSSPLREDFVAMIGGVMGNLPRWQLWFADRFAAGLTARELLACGRESQRLLDNHWAETESGSYAEGATRRLFGKSWQPKGWATENRQAVAALGKFLAALADPSADTAARGARAASVLEEFRRNQDLSGLWSSPNSCAPGQPEAIASIETPEEYQRYDQADPAPKGQHPGGRRGGRMRGVNF